jgi:DNA-binding LytR/AlgR family response regulator
MGEKIKCVIIEDEQHTSRLMEDYVSKIKQLELMGTFISPISLLNYDKLDEIQLIYLDIQMPEMTGIDFLKSIPTNAEIILTTAYSEYALQGYELNVTDYLLKPVELGRFIAATNKAIENIKLKQLRDTKSGDDEYIIVKVDKKHVKINIKDIVYIQSDWNYMNIYTTKEKHMVLGTLKSIEETLSAKNFVRIHKSYLINLSHVEFIEGNQVQLNGIKLQISRNYKNTLLERL